MMTQTDFSAWLGAQREFFDEALANSVASTSAAKAPKPLRDAMTYALLSGGKRVRPGLCQLAFESVSASQGRRSHEQSPSTPFLPAALACEMIHAYSLIHDDLPCMDDDNLRRGQPTTHIAFGEATAVLAGDALQTLAFELLAMQPDAELVRDQALLLSQASGAHGMVGGQVLDMLTPGADCGLAQVDAIHRAKTGALLTASVLLGVRAAQGDVDRWRAYAEPMGLLFQATDDLLDLTATTAELGKTAGKDAATQKPTLVAAVGESA
ncbi:MAG: polyprenyl synthetase family protein, partial [Planctomycetes bacterium]|nr:polyprenyl synthetase family protein [Planctomycetota bacterium]